MTLKLNSDSKAAAKIIQLLSKMMGMIEADVAASQLANVIEQASSDTVKFFIKGKPTKNKRRNAGSEKMLKELMAFSEEFTGEKL